MPTPVEVALHTLLPTISYPPTDLIALASSLLSQSRAVAASLKPEEDIARSYVCAHIACERLKNRLGLEVAKPKPPCPPRTYNKLYQYLDGALDTPRTPTANRKKDALQGSTTPSSRVRSQPTAEVRTPRNSSKRSRTTTTEGEEEKEGKSKQEEEVPSFVLPLVRAICTATRTPKATPHVSVGAGAALREITSRATQRATDGEATRKRRRKTPRPPSVSTGVADAMWPPLLVALHVFTVARMRGLERTDEHMGWIRQEATQAGRDFIQAQSSDVAPRLGTVLEKDVDFYLLEAEDGGWLEMEWYRNIPEKMEEAEMGESDGSITPRKPPSKTPLRRKEKHGGKEGHGDIRGALEDDPGAAGLLPGLGTMFQPAIDWLSEDRRDEYTRWKRSVLKEIAAIESEA
jgi:origin recognition complex subunit 6